MKERTLRRIKTTALGIATLAGASITAQGMVESHHNNPEAIERKVAVEIPGYDPDAFQMAQEEIIVFRKAMDLKLNTIEVPENVRQAANYIEDHQTIYDHGNQVVNKENNKRAAIFLVKYIGGIVMVAGSMFGLYKLGKRNRQLPENAGTNTSSFAKA